MLQGNVESISKTSIVVKTGSDIITLSGAAVEKIAPTLTLGQVVEYDKAELPAVVQKPAAKQAAATQTTAAPRASSSPTERLTASSVAAEESCRDDERTNGLHSWK